MKIRELNKRIRQAKEEGEFKISWLDEALEDNRVFNKNLNHLVRSLDDLPVRFDISKVEKKPSPRKRGKDVLYQYVQEVSRRQRMNREEEVRFSKRLNFFEARLLHAVKKSNLTEEEKNLLLRSAGCSNQVADGKSLCKDLGFCPSGKEGLIQDSCASYNEVRREFIERNLYLVVNMARQYSSFGVSVMDLVQEGNTALIRAVEKYDWRKEVRFQTYASFWLKQAIERCITANRCIVRLPNYLQQKMRRFKREGKISSDKSDLSVGEVSEAFSLSPKIAGRLLESDRGHVSLDAAYNPNEDGNLVDTLAVEDEEFIPEGERKKLKQRLDRALATLTQQERYILNHRFGLEGKKVKTLEELGRFMNVSRERIRQLQFKAIEKLKRPNFSRQLAPFLS